MCLFVRKTVVVEYKVQYLALKRISIKLYITFNIQVKYKYLVLTYSPPLAALVSKCSSISSVWHFPIGDVDTAVLAKCNPCLSSPCLNQGICHSDLVEIYRCSCPPGFKVRACL